MDILRIGEGHIDEVAKLLKKEFLKPPYNETWILSKIISRVEEVFQDNRKYCFVALENHAVIGVVLASTFIFRDGERCFVEEFVIDSKSQNKGIGTQLLGRLEDECRKAKIKTLWLTANQKSNAKNFYTKNGFKASDYRLMEKRIE